jgi:hypothetical protein
MLEAAFGLDELLTPIFSGGGGASERLRRFNNPEKPQELFEWHSQSKAQRSPAGESVTAKQKQLESFSQAPKIC